VDGTPHPTGPAQFAEDLGSVTTDGHRLEFTGEAQRVHAEHRWLVSSDYVQPFGAFAGSLPHAGRLTGQGVMERHVATW
jgi:hypothetical protein